MILRKGFKATVVDSWASTKYRGPLSKFREEMAKNRATYITMNSHHCMFLLSNCRYRLLYLTSGIHQATSTSNRDMESKVPRVYQHEHFPVIWKNGAGSPCWKEIPESNYKICLILKEFYLLLKSMALFI